MKDVKKSTEELLNKIKETTDIEHFMKENEADFIHTTVPEYLDSLVARKSIKISEVAERSGQGDYVYKVFQGSRKASRDILLAIAFGMSLTLDETQTLLRVAGNAQLDPRSRRDSVIIYGLCKKMKITEVCEILYELKERIF
jgi:hypothetical protein